MSLFFGRSEVRQMTDAAGALTGGWGAGATGRSSMRSALRVMPAYSATDLIANGISTLPVGCFEHTVAGERKPVEVLPTLIENPNPNPRGTRVDSLMQAATSLKLRGNAFGVIVDYETYRGRLIASKIDWLNPDSVRVNEDGGLPQYFYNGRALDRAAVVHIADYLLPGSVIGLSPVELFRTQLEMGRRVQEYGNQVFRRGGPSGHLRNTERTLNTPEAQTAKARFQSSVAAGEVFVSGKDWTYETLGLSIADSRFLESIKATANQIASIYHVPPEEIGGESGGSLTYSTVELNQIKFTLRAIQPTTVRVEAHLNRLLPAGMYAKFNLNAHVRGDLKSRMESYEIGLRNGVYTLAQVRELEDSSMLSDQDIEQWQQWYRQQQLTPAAPERTPLALEGGQDA